MKTLERIRSHVAGVKTLAAAERAAIDAEYRKLVGEVADERELTPETVLAILESCGRDAERLSADVETFVTRRDLQNEIAIGQTDFDERSRRHREDREAFNAEVKRSNEAFAKRHLELDREQDDLRALSQTTFDLRQRLAKLPEIA